jgi:DNA modification methylase
LEKRAIGDIKPNPRNARRHPERQLKELDRSFRQFGQYKPVLVDETGMLLAGHGTVLGAQRAGATELFVVVASGWSEETKRAVMLADNKLGLNSKWDDALLGIEVADLSKIKTVDMAALGFSAADLQRLIKQPVTEGLSDADVAPAAPKVPVSRLGDVWLLGAHRLVCGDCTNADHVAAALAGARPLLMVTDPPYGVDYNPQWRNEAERGNGRAVGARATGEVMNDDRADWRAAWALFPGDVAYCWHAGLYASSVQASLEAADFEMRSQIIWAKDRLVISRGDYHWQHEPCWYAVRAGKTGHWAGDRSQTTLWNIEHRKSETGHGTQKPIECMQRPILNNSRAGDHVYEPFSGSGTTLIAAEATGRICHALEINPAYVDVAVRRWETFTGRPATLAASGLEFAAVSAERRQALSQGPAPEAACVPELAREGGVQMGTETAAAA